MGLQKVIHCGQLGKAYCHSMPDASFEYTMNGHGVSMSWSLCAQVWWSIWEQLGLKLPRQIGPPPAVNFLILVESLLSFDARCFVRVHDGVSIMSGSLCAQVQWNIWGQLGFLQKIT